MNEFSIRDIENLCGVKAHTLRVWEQRYQLFVPKRKDSQHRVYDCDDLKELLRISFLYHNGFKISRIAELSSEEIQAEVARINPPCCNYEAFVHQLIGASLEFDSDGFEKIVDNLERTIGLKNCVLNVLYPFLQRIGLLWMTNHIIPAQEHFASQIIRNRIIDATDALEQVPEQSNNVVIFSPPGELHEIPLLFVNYLLLSNGVRTTYFGCDIDMDTLSSYDETHHISHFYTHMITHLDNAGRDSFICSLCRQFTTKPILLSGPACGCIQKYPDNLRHFCTVEDFLEILQKK
jgi:DNA-binding transcriptional MerR regulator